MERPIETQLARLTDCWQISQPLHLRHLAIVKDIALSGRSSHYVYFTYENFKKRVESGNASWEAVINIAENDQRAKKYGVALGALPKLDDFGFPSIQTSLLQDEQNVASLHDCSRSFKPAAITEYRHLVVKENEDGTSGKQSTTYTLCIMLTLARRRIQRRYKTRGTHDHVEESSHQTAESQELESCKGTESSERPKRSTAKTSDGRSSGKIKTQTAAEISAVPASSSEISEKQSRQSNREAS